MKWVKPDYSERFACLKGDCRHSCCVGWEIDIDAESLARFRRLSGAIGDRLRSEIRTGTDGAYFVMDAHGRCPFLNEDGLCELIIEAGEDILCQICADHPRFRSFFSDRQEMGFGLCCEAAARLILENTDRVLLLEEGTESLAEEEKELLELRGELIEIMQDRSLPVEARVNRLLEHAELNLDADLREWAAFLLTLEHLEAVWPERLKRLVDAETIPELSGTRETEVAFEQLMVYLLYRHLPLTLDDDDLAGHVLYCALMWRVIRALAAMEGFSMENMEEICREYSAEIEYSDENIEAILTELYM